MKITALAAAALLTTLVRPVAADVELPRISPDATVSQTLGLTKLSVKYSRPGVKGRTVWGELVPYGKPWRTGANNATTFTTSDAITFGGRKLPAGTYGLATIPGASEWTVVLNSQTDVWGTDYDDSKDVMRVAVKPEAAPHQEWFSIGFEDFTPAGSASIANQANLVLRWEKLRVAVPIAVEVVPKAIANYRIAVTEAKPDNWRTPYNAARYAFDNETALDEARVWLDKSLAVEKNYSNLTLLARLQMKDGKTKDALASARQAIAAGKASQEKVDTSETEKLVEEWSAKGSSRKS